MLKTKLKVNLILIFVLASCGFTSGLYEDILQAQELTKQHKFYEASKIYEKVITKKPSHNVKIKVYFQLGEINSVFLNNPKKAISYYKEVIKISIDPLWQIKSLEKIANINFEIVKDYDSAIVAYNKLIDFIPKLEKDYVYQFNIARSYFYKKEFEKSLNAFEKLKKKDTLFESYRYIGLIHYYQYRWPKAISSWFEYLKREKLKNKIVQVKFLIANAYESAEELKKAYNIYYSLLGEYPNQEVLKSRLKSIYERRVARKR